MHIQLNPCDNFQPRTPVSMITEFYCCAFINFGDGVGGRTVTDSLLRVHFVQFMERSRLVFLCLCKIYLSSRICQETQNILRSLLDTVAGILSCGSHGCYCNVKIIRVEFWTRIESSFIIFSVTRSVNLNLLMSLFFLLQIFVIVAAKRTIFRTNVWVFLLACILIF